jgi:hypothetical protein
MAAEHTTNCLAKDAGSTCKLDGAAPAAAAAAAAAPTKQPQVTDLSAQSSKEAEASESSVGMVPVGLEARAVRDEPVQVAWGRGIKTTESLSAAASAAAGDIERFVGVQLLTGAAPAAGAGQGGTAREASVMLSFGVFWARLDAVTEESFAKRVDAAGAPQRFWAPAMPYWFCIHSLDEFVDRVLVAAGGWIYWPRTRRFYAVPAWYRDELPKALAAIRTPPHPQT